MAGLADALGKLAARLASNELVGGELKNAMERLGDHMQGIVQLKAVGGTPKAKAKGGEDEEGAEPPIPTVEQRINPLDLFNQFSGIKNALMTGSAQTGLNAAGPIGAIAAHAIGKAQEAGGYFSNALSADQRGMGTFSNVLRGGSSLMGMVDPAGTNPITVMTKFGAEVLESIDKLRDWSKTLHNTNMQFAEFSASMTAVQARQELFDILLSQERGERRANSAEYLAEGRRQLEPQVAKWEDVADKAKNIIGGLLDKGVARLLEPLEPMVDKLGDIEDAIVKSLGGGEKAAEQYKDWLEFVDTQKKWAEMKGKPKRFVKT